MIDYEELRNLEEGEIIARKYDIGGYISYWRVVEEGRLVYPRLEKQGIRSIGRVKFKAEKVFCEQNENAIDVDRKELGEIEGFEEQYETYREQPSHNLYWPKEVSLEK